MKTGKINNPPSKVLPIKQDRSLTVNPQPLLDVEVLLGRLYARERHALPERVAELRGAVPVQGEVPVEVALTPDLVEGHRATAARLVP